MLFTRNTKTNNAMKKLITILSVLFLVTGIYAQRATVLTPNASWISDNTITLNGAVRDTIDFPTIQGEYDISLQLIPALSGSGDSLHFSHVIQQSNSDVDAVWTLITSSVNVFTVRDADALVAVTDFKGLRLRAICLGVSTDSCTVTPYYVFKKHDNE